MKTSTFTLVCSFYAKPDVGRSLNNKTSEIVGQLKNKNIPPKVAEQLKDHLEKIHLHLNGLEKLVEENSCLQ